MQVREASLLEPERALRSTRRLRSFGAWLALALLGQAASLQLIDAGNLLHYQHYKVQTLSSGIDRFLVLFLVVQAAIVFVGLARHWSKLWQLISSRLRTWQILVLSLVFILSSTVLSSSPRAYLSELFVASFIQAVGLANILLVMLALPPQTMAAITKRLNEFSTNAVAKQRIDRVAVFGAIWVTVLATLLSVYSYQRFPHIPDEVVYYFQARHFAAGQLTLPAPPVVEGFEIFLMDQSNGRWFTSTQPGWPLVLAVGMFFGVPWIINPLLAGLNVLLIYALLNALYDQVTARLAILLVCVSPWYVFMGMNFMTHMVTLTCVLIAALGIVWTRKTGRQAWAFVAGAAISFAGLIRPLDAFVILLVLGLWALGLGGKRLRLAGLASFVLGGLLLAAPVLLYNKLLTGSALQFPVNAYFDSHFGPGTNALGFGPQRGVSWPLDPFPGHSPLDALINANLNIASINVELFGWSIGSLLFITLLVITRRKQTADHLMIAVMVAVFVAHAFYYFSGGPDFGARYWFLMFVSCVALTARGMQVLATLRGGAANGKVELNAPIMLAVFLLSAMALINVFPWRAIDKYHNYLRMNPEIAQLEQAKNFGRSLVLVRGNQHPDYASAWSHNPLDLRSGTPIYAWDRNLEVRNRLLNYYHDRPIWVLDGPTLTGSGFRVVAGPISAHEAKTLPNLSR